MEKVTSADGTTVSYERYGDGPPLVLVHGSFSDHATNWEHVKPLLETRFTVLAVARRGRGETDATEGHRVEDEAEDVAAVIASAGEPAFVLGHSYGGVCALAGTTLIPEQVRKLVLYEPPWPNALDPELIARLQKLAAAGELEALVEVFMREVLQVPPDEVAAIRETPFWEVWIADAIATQNDLRALTAYSFDPEAFLSLAMPVLLQVGTESPRDIYVTDALAAVLPDVRIEALEGQAHEAMTMAPEMYANAVIGFLLE